MAYFVKIDEKDDFNHLKRYIDLWHSRCQDSTTYVEYVDMFARLQKAFEGPLMADEVTVAKEAPKVTRAPRLPALNANLCKDHPAYKALRAPRTDCSSCWVAFAKLAGKPRAKQARDKFDRQRKKLNEGNTESK